MQTDADFDTVVFTVAGKRLDGELKWRFEKLIVDPLAWNSTATHRYMSYDGLEHDQRKITLANMKKNYGASVHLSNHDTGAAHQEAPPVWTPPDMPKLRSAWVQRCQWKSWMFPGIRVESMTRKGTLDHRGFPYQKIDPIVTVQISTKLRPDEFNMIP